MRLVLFTALKNDAKIIELDEAVMESRLMNIWFIVGSIDQVFRERESEAFLLWLLSRSMYVRWKKVVVFSSFRITLLH